ncbi:MAG: hypothetical protein KJZ62_02255 [Fimbriimonadaceae bacterium]|nr:hypothetical protein [Fimbriimonadaceae bacterium]QOJ12724.1 MAG: hypothetical protein HRU74_11940 [Chthonomonadaceae bacterium]
MSAAKRAYDLLRGHLSREWDRIKQIERDLAESELEESMRNPPPVAAPPLRTPEQIAADRIATARRLLGITEKDGFPEIRAAFERLSSRSDPSKFPDRSEEQRQAEQIQKRVHWAYQVLTESVDVTIKRFSTLELD